MSSRKRTSGPSGSLTPPVQQQQQLQTEATTPVPPEQFAPFFGGRSGDKKPQNPVCPECKRPMVVKQVTPVLFASELDDVLYKCDACSTESKRTIKRN